MVLFLASAKVWAYLTLAITLLGVREWAGLIRLGNRQMLSLVAAVFVLGLLSLNISATALAPYQHQIILGLLAISACFWVAVAPVWLFTRKPSANRLIMSFLGLLLLLATWLGLIGLHSINPWLVLAVIATVSLADSAAYFAGKRFGRHKLAPEISPGKTWEGVAGAMIAITIYGAVLCSYFQYSLVLIPLLWLIVILSIMGDLTESLLKRHAGMKDSGQLLPGHGGVLDRIDGLIPTLPISLLCIYLPFFARFHLHA